MDLTLKKNIVLPTSIEFKTTVEEDRRELAKVLHQHYLQMYYERKAKKG